MIVNFSIQNFGSIKDKQTLSFEADASQHLEDTYVVHTAGKRLLKLALIYGDNASGKTTVLKALDFLRDLVVNPKEMKYHRLNFFPFLFDEKSSSLPSFLSIEFIQNNICYLYEVTFTYQSILLENLSSEGVIIYNRKTFTEKQLTEIYFGDKINLEDNEKRTLEVNTLWNNTVLGGYLKTNINIDILTDVLNWFEFHLKPIVLSNTILDDFVTKNIDRGKVEKQSIIDILSQADFHISDFSIRKVMEDITNYSFEELSKRGIKDLKPIDHMEVAFKHSVNGNQYAIPFELESEGTKRFYGFAGLLALLIKTPTIFPIDELESSLHPDLYTHFLLSFLQNAQHSQLIATTHNRELLGDTDIFRNDVIWFTNKGEDCATELYSLADFDTSAIKNFLNAYKIGKFSGVPHLSDTFINLEQ